MRLQHWALLLTLSFPSGCLAQTTVSDTIYASKNVTFSGVLKFTARSTGTVTTSAVSGGSVSVSLAVGQYTVDYLQGAAPGADVCTEKWIVPASSTALSIFQARGTSPACNVFAASDLPQGTGNGSGSLPAGTGLVKTNSGVGAIATPGTDFIAPIGGSGVTKTSGGSLLLASAADIVAMFSGCNSGTPLLSYTGTCAAASGGVTTPATSFLLKGNGSANIVIAATPGTDYFAAIGGTGLLKNSGGALSIATASDVPQLAYSSLSGLPTLGTAAAQNSTAFDSSGAAAAVLGSSLQKSSNLSDLASAATARTNLGLTFTGSTTKAASSTGSVTTNHCASWDASGNVVDAGAACGTSSLPSGAANLFLATPNGSSGTAALRAIVDGDLPALPYLSTSGPFISCQIYSCDGAGVNDTHTTLQNGISGTATAGACLYIPAGTYRLTTQLYAKTNACVYADPGAVFFNDVPNGGIDSDHMTVNAQSSLAGTFPDAPSTAPQNDQFPSLIALQSASVGATSFTCASGNCISALSPAMVDGTWITMAEGNSPKWDAYRAYVTVASHTANTIAISRPLDWALGTTATNKGFYRYIPVVGFSWTGGTFTGNAYAVGAFGFQDSVDTHISNYTSKIAGNIDRIGNAMGAKVENVHYYSGGFEGFDYSTDSAASYIWEYNAGSVGSESDQGAARIDYSHWFINHPTGTDIFADNANARLHTYSDIWIDGANAFTGTVFFIDGLNSTVKDVHAINMSTSGLLSLCPGTSLLPCDGFQMHGVDFDGTAGNQLYLHTATHINVSDNIFKTNGGGDPIFPGFTDAGSRVCNNGGTISSTSLCDSSTALPSQSVQSYLKSNGTSASWGDIITGPSGALCAGTGCTSGTPGIVDIVTSVVPRLAAANTFTGVNKFQQLQVNLYTVGTLPTCNGSFEGQLEGVTDAAASPVYNATATGGGGVHIPVYCNGSNWVNH